VVDAAGIRRSARCARIGVCVVLGFAVGAAPAGAMPKLAGETTIRSQGAGYVRVYLPQALTMYEGNSIEPLGRVRVRGGSGPRGLFLRRDIGDRFAPRLFALAADGSEELRAAHSSRQLPAGVYRLYNLTFDRPQEATVVLPGLPGRTSVTADVGLPAQEAALQPQTPTPSGTYRAAFSTAALTEDTVHTMAFAWDVRAPMGAVRTCYSRDEPAEWCDRPFNPELRPFMREPHSGWQAAWMSATGGRPVAGVRAEAPVEQPTIRGGARPAGLRSSQPPRRADAVHRDVRRSAG
jgi:hypothetical protein